MKTVVLATRNAGKISELSELLAPFHLRVAGLDAYPRVGEIAEDGDSFEANALIKARAVCDIAGVAAIADDSGLEVDALDGAPGVYSARFSGPGATDEKNNVLLLARLAGVPALQRTARFRCVVAVAAPGGRTLTASGAWEGLIADAPRGTGGFGYDPVFFDPELGLTAAELSREQKNARSHRGRALRALLDRWPAFWAAVAD